MKAPEFPEILPETAQGLKIYAVRPMLGHLRSEAA